MASTSIPISPELKAAFEEAQRDKTIRYLKVIIKDGSLVLESKVNTKGTTSIDFNGLKTAVTTSAACYFIFRANEFPPHWSLISFIPDEISVNDRTLYAGTISVLKPWIGSQDDRRYSDVEELTWANFQRTPQSPSEKPWSKRELITQQLDKGEEEARRELKKDGPSGFKPIHVPLTAGATQAIDQLKVDTINWLQLVLTPDHKNLDAINPKTVSGVPTEHLDPVESAFYLYKTGSTVILIYCCPDKSQLKNRMLYPACKAPLAEDLSKLGLTNLKKMNVTDPTELTEANIQRNTSGRSSGLFKPDIQMMSPSSQKFGGGGGVVGGVQINKNEFNSSKPVFNRPGFNRDTEDSSEGSNTPKARNIKQGQVPSALRILTANNSNQKPKGIVIPPEGAYSI